MVDVKTLKVIRQLSPGPDPELLDVDPTGTRIYIANEDDAMVTVSDIASGNKTNTLEHISLSVTE